MRRAIAIALLVALARPAFAEGEAGQLPELRLKMDAPPPAGATKLLWAYGDTEWIGYWFHAPQVQQIQLRIKMLEAENEYLAEKSGKECFDAQVKASEGVILGHPAFLIGGAVGVVVGAVVGIIVYSKLK